MLQVRLVLSLFPARPSPSGVAEEVGLPCALRKVVPASFRLAALLAVLASGCGMVSRAQSAGVSMRMAVPGAWSVCGVAAVGPMDGAPSTWRWKGSLRWGSAGFGGLGLVHGLRVDENSHLGVGCVWYPGTLGLVHTGGRGALRWGVHWPLVQPAPAPYRPNAWLTWTSDVGQHTDFGARLDVRPGALPEIACSVSRGRWQCAIGSRGGFAAVRLGDEGAVSIRCFLGVTRGDIPWMGVDPGNLPWASAPTSGPLHTTDFPW